MSVGPGVSAHSVAGLAPGLGDQEPVAEVRIVLGPQVAEPGVPSAVVEVRGEPGEALVERGRGDLGEGGYAPAHTGIEVGVGPAPESAEKAVDTVVRHEHRVYLVQTIISGSDDADIEQILKKLLAIAGTDFDQNPRLVPFGEYLGCTDGLSARIVRTQQILSRTIPLLVVHVEHPRLNLRARGVKRPQECVNLPKHLYE